MRPLAKGVFATATSIVALGIAMPANAGSFALKERSARAQGASFAGATAGSGGLSSMGFNPAAIGLVPAGQDSLMTAGGLSYVLPTAEGQASIGGAPVGAAVDPGRDAGLAYGYIGYRLEEDILVGASLYTPFGLVTQYEAGWLGQFDAITSKLQTFTIAPTVAWQPNPDLTLAVAMNLNYSNVRLTTAATQLTGDTTNLGFSVGALWNATNSTTIGVAYQHGYELDIDGNLTINGVASVSANAKSELPAVASLGIVQGITDDFRLLGEVQWQDWSAFDRIDVSSGGALVQSDIQNYSDAFYVAGGAEYDATDAFTVRLGAAWDQTPTNSDVPNGLVPAAANPQATSRTARVPDEDRLWLSIGASYDVNDHMTVDFGYSYLFTLENPVVGLRAAPAGAQVSYDGTVHIFSIGGSMKF